jgi:hypothetical protein
MNIISGRAVIGSAIPEGWYTSIFRSTGVGVPVNMDTFLPYVISVVILAEGNISLRNLWAFASELMAMTIVKK